MSGRSSAQACVTGRPTVARAERGSLAGSTTQRQGNVSSSSMAAAEGTPTTLSLVVTVKKLVLKVCRLALLSV